MFKLNVIIAMMMLALSAGNAQDTPRVKGTIEKVDADAQKLSIEHEAIPNLQMDGMTMVFRVADKALLSQLRAGDRVEFTADRVDGQITVTSIKKTR